MQQRVADVEGNPYGHVRRIQLSGDQSTPELPPRRATCNRAPDPCQRDRQLMETVQVHTRQSGTRKLDTLSGFG